MSKDIRSQFSSVVRYYERDGSHCYKCPLGLWAVQAPDREYALKEAMGFFESYLDDGEYNRGDK